jgi:hypothetical protein
MSKAPINLWANFLANHGLSPSAVGPEDVEKLVHLCQLLAEGGEPICFNCLACRRRVCLTAIDAEIDLIGFTSRGRVLMNSSLLETWNQVYAERFGTIVGTAGAREATRRATKARLGSRNSV